MRFRTEIKISQSSLTISHKDKILMCGSCFIENIGKLLMENKFNVNLNPFGVLYNPESINQSLRFLIENKRFEENDIFEHKGLFQSFYHHSLFSETDKDSFLANINNRLEKASDDLRRADILFITFGTAYVFRSKEKDMVVGNCHKLPASFFDRYRLEVKDIVAGWQAVIKRLKLLNPKLQIVFTVSPIRHMQDGAHENQLSKSTLLLAIDQLQQQDSAIHYFPSYEIVLDDLRDYRFYNEDMVHPSSTAIKYIWEKLADTYFTRETNSVVEEWGKIQIALNHRPFNEQGDDYKHFLRQTLLKLKRFEEKYPYICCSDEILTLERKL